MSSKDLAVSVRGLSKSYTIAHKAENHTTLSEALLHRFKEPLQRAEKETFWALKDLDFNIHKGDVVGVIGRNGAGKSTLLKILSQITEPTSGEIRLYGRIGSLLEVGTGFHPELTGRENVFLNGAILGMRKSEIQRQFDAIVDFAGVEKFLDTPVKRYSSGMYVRLAFAVAAHLNPEILIIDEVLAVGDAEFQKKCLGKMQDVSSREGKTVVFVSHNMGAVRSLCSSALWLKNGRLLEYGSTSTIINAYLGFGIDDSKGFIDLNQEPRPPGAAQRFKFSGLSTNDGKPLMHGEPISFSLNFESNGSIQDVIVGVGISTLDGVRLLTCESNYLGESRNLHETKGTISTQMECYLQPGQYSLDVGARSGKNEALDYLPACAIIEILPGPNTPPELYDGFASVRLPTNWMWETS